MKYILIILFSASFVNAKCWVIANGTEIVDTKGFTPAGAVQICPLDPSNKSVQNPSDISFIDTGEVDIEGNPIFQWQFDQVKYDARIAAKQAQDAIGKGKSDARTAKFNSIKGKCVAAGGVLKEMCEYITNQ